MVAMRVEDEIHNVSGHLIAHQQEFVVEFLGVLSRHFDQGLDSASAMHVNGDLDHHRGDRWDQLLKRVDGGHLDEPLHKVVAKLVRHHVGHDLEGQEDMDDGTRQAEALASDNFRSGREPFLNLLLDHPGSGLVKGELLNLPANHQLLLTELASEMGRQIVKGGGLLLDSSGHRMELRNGGDESRGRRGEGVAGGLEGRGPTGHESRILHHNWLLWRQKVVNHGLMLQIAHLGGLRPESRRLLVALNSHISQGALQLV